MATYDEFGREVADPTPAPTPNNSSTVDDGSDPYVSNGQSTVPATTSSSTVDDGSDPYVSNGQSTVPRADENPQNTDEPSVSAKGGTRTKTETYESNEPWVTGNRNDPLAYKEIYDLNSDLIGKDVNRLMPGWVLQMPNGGTYTVVYGDTLTWIAQGRGKGTYSQTLTRTVPDKTSEFSGIQVTKKPVLEKNDFEQKPDWRVRLSLAPHANYLYRTAAMGEILYPLMETDGVIFPYTPAVSVAYSANYEGIDLAHTNYKMYQYKNSEVGAITITGTFTAQTNKEASYLLAVMHFFKSVTKMFYGQDSNPKNGTPPPLCYLSGYGAYQFDNHPLAITGFTMNLPDDVDYVRAGKVSDYTFNVADTGTKSSGKSSLWESIKARLSSSRLNKGGLKNEPVFTNLSNKEATYVPTKMVITITAVPVVTRNDISNNFSVEKYARGELTRGSKRPQGGGGIW